MKRLWKWVCLFAFRRWATPGEKKPIGIPYNRDPDHPCDGYEPRPYERGDWNDRRTDNHYLCDGCCHRQPDEEESAQ